MAYEFVNRETGKATVQNQGTTSTVTINGVNTKTVDADTFHRAIELFVGIVNWTAGDMSRVVTEDIVSTS